MQQSANLDTLSLHQLGRRYPQSRLCRRPNGGSRRRPKARLRATVPSELRSRPKGFRFPAPPPAALGTPAQPALGHAAQPRLGRAAKPRSAALAALKRIEQFPVFFDDEAVCHSGDVVRDDARQGFAGVVLGEDVRR